MESAPSEPSDSPIVNLTKQLSSHGLVDQPPRGKPSLTTPKCFLESLPAEICLEILGLLPTVAALRAVSLASRVFNEVRLMHKTIVLRKVLMMGMGRVAFHEAYWAMRAKEWELYWSNFDEGLKEFRECAFLCIPTVPELNIHDLVKMSALHRRVEWLVQDYCAYSLLGPLSLRGSDASVEPLSPSELTRITRAFYRYETFYNLYRDRPEKKGGPIEVTWEDRPGTFFYHLKAWEIEEIACLLDYLRSRLDDVFVKIQRASAFNPLAFDFDANIYPNWEAPSPGILNRYVAGEWGWGDEYAPCGASFLPNSDKTRILRNMFLSQGLDFLSRLIAAESDEAPYQMFQSIMNVNFRNHRNIVGLITAKPRACVADPLDEAYEEYEAFVHGDADSFEGDKDNADGLNFAWAFVHKSKVQIFASQNDLGYCRRCGYVMWDETRLKRAPFWKDAYGNLGGTPSLPYSYINHKEKENIFHDDTCNRTPRQIQEAEESGSDTTDDES